MSTTSRRWKPGCRNLNYLAPVYLDFTVVEDGIEKEPERVHIGDLPVMVKSKKCTLYKENMEQEQRDATSTSTASS